MASDDGLMADTPPIASTLRTAQVPDTITADEFLCSLDDTSGIPDISSIVRLLSCHPEAIEPYINSAIHSLAKTPGVCIDYDLAGDEPPEVSAVKTNALAEVRESHELVRLTQSTNTKDLVLDGIWAEAVRRRRSAIAATTFRKRPQVAFSEASTQPSKRQKTTKTPDGRGYATTNFPYEQIVIEVFANEDMALTNPLCRIGTQFLITSREDMELIMNKTGSRGKLTHESVKLAALTEELFRALNESDIEELEDADGDGWTLWSVLEHIPIPLVTQSLISDQVCVLKERSDLSWPVVVARKGETCLARGPLSHSHSRSSE
jgi:hypothetical protein